MIPVMTSFLPPTHTHLYLPMMFKLWEAFNSSVIDDRLLELCGELSEEHIAGPLGDSGEGATQWKDVGIWTEQEWTMLVGKALGSMSKTPNGDQSLIVLTQALQTYPLEHLVCVEHSRLSSHITHLYIQGASSTSSHADFTGDRSSLRIKKVISRYCTCAFELSK